MRAIYAPFDTGASDSELRPQHPIVSSRWSLQNGENGRRVLGVYGMVVPTAPECGMSLVDDSSVSVLQHGIDHLLIVIS